MKYVDHRVSNGSLIDERVIIIIAIIFVYFELTVNTLLSLKVFRFASFVDQREEDSSCYVAPSPTYY